MSKYDSIKEQIKKDYETTPKSLRQLAKEYNVSYDTVWTWSKKFNWTSSVTKIKTDVRTTSQEIVNIAKNLFENTSMNLKEISDNINIPRNTIQVWKQKYNWIKKEQYLEEYKHNLDKRGQHINLEDDSTQLIKKLYETTSLSVVEISNIVNLTIDQVWNRINKFNFQRTTELKHQAQSNKIKKIIANMSEEQKQQQRQKMSKTNKEIWANRSENKKQEIIQHRLETINNKSEKELQEIRNKISESVKKKIPEINYKRIINMKKAKSLTGKYFDSNYETKIYDICIKNNLITETQVPIQYINKSGKSLIDFKINNELYECKGSHLLKDVYKNSKIEDKLNLYSSKYITVVTDKQGIDILKQYNNFVYKTQPINYISINNTEEELKNILQFNKKLYFDIMYNFLKRNNINFKCNVQQNKHYFDFIVDGLKFIILDINSIKQQEQYLRDNKIIVITNKLNNSLIPKPNSTESNGLKYLSKCPNPLIGIDIDLLKNPQIPYREDRPKCFYDVRVDGKPSVSEAWQDELLRWKMIKNRIDYVGGFIDNRQILTAMNVTRNCKQPSWFSKQYAKELIQKYITTNIILDPFAGWGTRCDACKELNIKYYGWDLNKELVDWHKEKGRLFETGCGIEYGDANNIKTDRENCSVFICPPYTDFETYFEGQDLKTTQCEWLQIVMNNIPNAKEYLMVCKVVDPGFEKYIVEEKINKSHLGINKEYVLLIKNEI